MPALKPSARFPEAADETQMTKAAPFQQKSNLCFACDGRIGPRTRGNATL
jgi:hypothetical protein